MLMTRRHKWMMMVGVASAVVVAIAQVVARRGAGVVWERLTGTRPPLPRQRRKRLAPG